MGQDFRDGLGASSAGLLCGSFGFVSPHKNRIHQGRWLTNPKECDIVLGAEVEDGIAIADGGARDQLGGRGNAIAVEVRRDLQLIARRIEVGDRVVPGIVP